MIMQSGNWTRAAALGRLNDAASGKTFAPFALDAYQAKLDARQRVLDEIERRESTNGPRDPGIADLWAEYEEI